MKDQIVNSLGALTLGLAIAGVSLITIAQDKASDRTDDTTAGTAAIPPPPPGPYRYVDTETAPAMPVRPMQPIMPPPPVAHGGSYEAHAEVHAESGSPPAYRPGPMRPPQPQWGPGPNQPPAQQQWGPGPNQPPAQPQWGPGPNQPPANSGWAVPQYPYGPGGPNRAAPGQNAYDNPPNSQTPGAR